MAGRSVSFIVLLLILVAGGAYWFQGRTAAHDGDRGKSAPVLVSLAPVAVKDVPVELSAVGSVVAYQSVTVRSRLDSQIMEVKFHPGDDVKAGDLLFQLDDRSIRAQIEEQQSNLARDEAQEKNLRLQYDRKKKLSGQGYETQENLEVSRAAYEAQHATVAATTAALDNLKVQLEYTRITAPISGRAGTIALTAGNNVKANDSTPLVTINQIRPIWVQVSLPQRYVEAVRQAKSAGAVVAMAQHEGGPPVTGVLDYVDNAVDTTTGTFALRATFPNEDEQLWPGMYVTVTLKVGDKSGALVIPEVAIQRGPEGDYAYVVADGHAARRAVKVDFIQRGEAVISEGVKGGEQVAVDGLMKLADGAAVDTAAGAGAAP